MSPVTLTADMPVLDNFEWRNACRKNPRLVRVSSVPRTMFDEAAERQAEKNHYQSLERLRQRGGLSPSEMIAVVTCCDFEAVGQLSRETGHRILYSMIALHRRGMRIAEAAHRDSGSRPEGEDSRSEAECEARQSGGEAASPKSRGPHETEGNYILDSRNRLG